MTRRSPQGSRSTMVPRGTSSSPTSREVARAKCSPEMLFGSTARETTRSKCSTTSSARALKTLTFPSVPAGFVEKDGFPLVGFDERNGPSRIENRHGMPGNPAPLPTSATLALLSPSCSSISGPKCMTEVKRLRIMAGHDLLERPDRREVQLPVPANKKLIVSLQLGNLGIRERDVGIDSRVQQICELAHAAELARLRYTSSTAMAAGVTPGILPAWPSVAGCTRSSLSWISRESPGIPWKENPPGMWRSSAFFKRSNLALLLPDIACVLDFGLDRGQDAVHGIGAQNASNRGATACRSEPPGASAMQRARDGRPPPSPNRRIPADWPESLPATRASRTFCVCFSWYTVHRASIDQSGCRPAGRQALIGVVDPQVQPELGARSEHPVRLVRPFADQVVDQDAGVAVGAAQHDWIRSADPVARH